MRENTKASSDYISDEDIVKLYWLRDESAVEATDIKYGHFLYTIGFNILHEHRDCEECKNDTYLSTWNSIPPARPTFFRAFIAQIMRRTAINRYYKNSGKRKIPSEFTVSMEECESLLSSKESADDEIDAKELGRIISGFVRELSPKRKYIFIGRFYFSEPVAVIASELKITQSAVYKELKKLRKDLKDFLESQEVYV